MRMIDADAFLNRVLPECKYPELLKKAVDEQPAVNRWISCSERLPEKHGEYMVCFGMCDCDLNGTDMIDKRYYGEKSDGTVGWHSLCSSDITHWMPMPDPPEKE